MYGHYELVAYGPERRRTIARGARDVCMSLMTSAKAARLLRRHGFREWELRWVEQGNGR